MKAENWFQLRLVGVTAIREPGFCRASSMEVGAPQSLWELRGGSICAVDEVLRRHTDYSEGLPELFRHFWKDWLPDKIYGHPSPPYPTQVY
jgi:hypothetical protein